MTLAQTVGDSMQHRGFLDPGQPAPGLERLPRRAHGTVGILRGPARNVIENSLVCRIEDGEHRPRGRERPATNPLPLHGHLFGEFVRCTILRQRPARALHAGRRSWAEDPLASDSLSRPPSGLLSNDIVITTEPV